MRLAMARYERPMATVQTFPLARNSSEGCAGVLLEKSIFFIGQLANFAGQAGVEFPKARRQEGMEGGHFAGSAFSLWARNSSKGTDFPALISASHFSSNAMPAPPSEKSFSICWSQAWASRAFSHATSEVFSRSGSSAIACLMTSSVIPTAYFLRLRNANTFKRHKARQPTGAVRTMPEPTATCGKLLECNLLNQAEPRNKHTL